jgi:HrpA-like RNA helicase
MSFWGDLRTHTTQDKNIIMFVPGKKEIQQHIDRIQETHGDLVEAFPLHADIPKNQQDALLVKNSIIPRIIVSTDIAAESITIPYANVVLDLGLAKVPSYSVHGVPSLRIENIALSQIEQRA